MGPNGGGVALDSAVVETEAIGDSGCTYERGPSLIGSLGSSCHAGTRYFCPALRLYPVVGPIQNIFCSPNTISIHLSQSPSKPGRQSCRVACFSICVSGHITGRHGKDEEKNKKRPRGG
jgi:hypothetical protein